MTIGEHSLLDGLELEFAKATSVGLNCTKKTFPLYKSQFVELYFQVSILNEEDIPHMLLTTLQFSQPHESTIQEILFSLQTIVNDAGVRDIDADFRKCIFPDEPFNTRYKYYSYSTCVTECLKQAQIRACNCTHFNMIYDGLYLNNFIINNISTGLLVF